MNKIIERTKNGYPALWESGGGRSNTGEATIIASPSGEPKKAIYIRSRGSLANAHHALVILEVGDYILEANHHRKDFNIYVYKILDFKSKATEEVATVEQVYEFSKGKWDKEPPAYLEQAVYTAMYKATCYHCREPHYIA